MTQPMITQQRGTFSLACRVNVNVRASAARIWALLTDAQAYPRWNSTVARIEGEIREGATLRVHAPGTDRTFTPRVSNMVDCERMTWTGGFMPVFKGVRTFELRSNGDNSIEFIMAERFSGLMLLLVKHSLPDFGPIFAQYARDLKREAER